MVEGNGRPSLFNISVDTGVLFAMLLAAVYFGATLRADLNYTLDAISKLDEKMSGGQVVLAKELAELKQRIIVLEAKPAVSVQATE